MHAVVPGSGPSLEGNHWLTAKHPDPSYRKAYLVCVKELGRAYRKHFLLGLRALIRCDKLRLEGQWNRLRDRSALNDWCRRLEATDWNVYIEGPPGGNSSPDHVLRYLTRYLSGGPIHDGRIIKDEEGWVHFYARDRKPRRPRATKLTGPLFVYRWAQHILPKGFTRTRRCGGYHPRHSKSYMAKCQELLSPVVAEPVRSSAEAAGVPAMLQDDASRASATVTKPEPRCPHCSAELLLVSSERRPSWKHLFDRELYRQSQVYSPVYHHYVRGPPD